MYLLSRIVTIFDTFGNSTLLLTVLESFYNVARIAPLGGKIGLKLGGKSANRVLTLKVTTGSLENRGHCFLSRNVLMGDMMPPIFSNL